MTTMTGGQALAQQLKLEGIDTIFALPGVQLDWAFDAIYEEKDHFRVIHTRHEQATAYMADGYARSTGKAGMALVVPGPGVLNTAAALSTAYACNSPVLCVTGQIDSKMIGVGRGLLHEVRDQMTALASVTKWQGRAMTPGDIPALVHEAFRQLHSGRPRPVELEVPPDVLQAQGDVHLLEAEMFERPAGDADAIAEAARLLAEARRPLIFAGGGIIRSGASAELLRLAEGLQAPVVMTVNGKGAISDRSHLAFPAVATAALARDADVILAAGTRFVAGAAPAWDTDRTSVIQLDIDPEEIGRNYQPQVRIQADARAGLAGLAGALGAVRRESREEELLRIKQHFSDHANRQQPQAGLALAVRAALPDDAIVVSESTQVGYWSHSYFPTFGPRTYFSSGYQGTLGYGFATALGVQAGNPDRVVVSLNGDGGFFYNVQELSTMAQQKLPLIAIVFNDNAYGNVKRIQQEQFGGRTIASDLHNPDMLKLADAYGVAGRRVSTPDELRRAIEQAVQAREPVLIEVPVGPMPRMQRPPEFAP